jgi:hypothetical protein
MEAAEPDANRTSGNPWQRLVVAFVAAIFIDTAVIIGAVLIGGYYVRVAGGREVAPLANALLMLVAALALLAIATIVTAVRSFRRADPYVGIGVVTAPLVCLGSLVLLGMYGPH